MDVCEMVGLLNDDLKNEYNHMLFYLHSGNMLRGLDRLHLGEMLYKHAEGEMEHVRQFAHKIRSLGGQPATGMDAPGFPGCHDRACDILRYALAMEEEVVRNYVVRRRQADEMGDVGLVLFLEDQIEHSQEDVDEIRQLLEAGS